MALRHVRSYAEHPARAFHKAGIPVSINTEAPPMFGTSLLQEYELAHTELGFEPDELVEINRQALEFVLTKDRGDLRWLRDRLFPAPI
jgi:adenosine deaminase